LIEVLFLVNANEIGDLPDGEQDNGDKGKQL
jgi:hypothetical protein